MSKNISRKSSSDNLIADMKQASLEQIELRSGSKVKIVGLKKFPKFNGQEGIISEGKDVFWTVKIPEQHNATVRVRSVNLELIEQGDIDEGKYTPKAIKAKEFLTWLTKELAENEPEDPAEFAFQLLKDNLAPGMRGSALSKKLEELQKDLDEAVAAHKFLEAHEMKEEMKDLKAKSNDIAAIEDKLLSAMKNHNFLLAHDLKEKMIKIINTPSKFNYKIWLNSLKPVDRAELLKLTKGSLRTLEWVTGLTASDLRGAISNKDTIQRLMISIRDLRATYL